MANIMQIHVHYVQCLEQVLLLYSCDRLLRQMIINNNIIWWF